MTAIFDKAVFSDTKSFTSLTGEWFIPSLAVDDYISYNCIKFNHLKTQNYQRLFGTNSLNPMSHYINFHINENTSISFLDIFISDNYLNILDWSQLRAGFTFENKKGLYFFLTKTQEYKLEEPYNQCQSMADLTYRQANCLAQCKNKNFVNKYDCTLRNYYSIPGYKICPINVTASEFDSECESQCPKECGSTAFQAAISEFESNALFTTNASELSFVYSDISYLEMSQTPKMTGFSLIASIGGALGLFIGIRFLSLVELFEYLTEIFCVLYKKENS